MCNLLFIRKMMPQKKISIVLFFDSSSTNRLLMTTHTYHINMLFNANKAGISFLLFYGREGEKIEKWRKNEDNYELDDDIILLFYVIEFKSYHKIHSFSSHIFFCYICYSYSMKSCMYSWLMKYEIHIQTMLFRIMLNDFLFEC